MRSIECPECGEIFEGEKSEVKKSLRAHMIGSNGHEYDSETFNELFEEDDTQQEDEDELEEISEPETEEEKESEEMELNEIENMEETDLDTLVKEADDGEDHKEESPESTRRGLDDAINKGWGRLLTADLDPEDDEVSNMRKNLQGLAEDVGLGENAKHYYDEHLAGDSDDPRTALLGSLVLAVILSLSLRPDIGKKIVNKAKEQRSGGEE